MDKTRLWKTVFHLAELVSFILILTAQKSGLILYMLTELASLCVHIFTDRAGNNLLFFVILFIVVNLLLAILFLLKKNGKSAWSVLLQKNKNIQS